LILSPSRIAHDGLPANETCTCGALPFPAAGVEDLLMRSILSFISSGEDHSFSILFAATVSVLLCFDLFQRLSCSCACNRCPTIHLARCSLVSSDVPASAKTRFAVAPTWSLKLQLPRDAPIEIRSRGQLTKRSVSSCGLWTLAWHRADVVKKAQRLLVRHPLLT